MSRRKIRKGSPQRNVPNEGGLDVSAIFDQYVVISRKRCILDTIWDGNRKPYASYRMVSVSMTLSDPWSGFQGHGSFKSRVSPKRRILQTQLLYRTLIGNHRHALDRQARLAIQLTTPLLLRKPWKLFASVARVCQRCQRVCYWQRIVENDPRSTKVPASPSKSCRFLTEPSSIPFIKVSSQYFGLLCK